MDSKASVKNISKSQTRHRKKPNLKFAYSNVI